MGKKLMTDEQLKAAIEDVKAVSAMQMAQAENDPPILTPYQWGIVMQMAELMQQLEHWQKLFYREFRIPKPEDSDTP